MLTVFGARASNFTSEKEFGFAVRTDRRACILRRPIDYLPNGKVLPIAQAYTEANGTADAANTLDSRDREPAELLDQL